MIMQPICLINAHRHAERGLQPDARYATRSDLVSLSACTAASAATHRTGCACRDRNGGRCAVRDIIVCWKIIFDVCA